MMQAQNGAPPKPEGYSLQSFFRRCVWEALWGGKFPFADTNTVKFSWNGSSYQAEAAPPGRGGGTTASTSNYRGVWNSSVTYAMNDMVLIQSGVAVGLYISVADDNVNDPATGINWVQLAPGSTLGSWT